MYILLSGFPPFNEKSRDALFDKIKNSEPQFK